MTTVAFFDLDYTLLDTSSGIIYVKELVKQRRVPFWLPGWIGLSYKLRQTDFGQAHLELINYAGQQGYTITQSFFNSWITRKLLPRLTKAGQSKINWHTQQGHRVVIISASIEEIVQPVARYLAVEYICTRLAVHDDRYTGRLDGPLCYGPGKVTLAERWASQNNLEFPQCVGYFYTDSASDVPLLELAQHPVAVNPSLSLARIATQRGWAIEKFY